MKSRGHWMVFFVYQLSNPCWWLNIRVRPYDMDKEDYCKKEKR